MEYSTLEEIYGNHIQNNQNNIPLPKRNIKKEQDLLYGSYKNSAEERKPELAHAISPEKHKKNIQLPDLSRPEDDLASVISDNNTVVMGGNSNNNNELGPIPGYADARQFATVNEVISQGLLDETKNNKPVEDSNSMILPAIFEQILEKVNELLTRVNYNQKDDKRNPQEVYVHIGLYFVTGLFVLYLLYYVFSLGKQNIKISLIK